MESSAMAINPQQPSVQLENSEHSIMSIDNHWQDLELVPFSSQTFEVQPPTSSGNEERQLTRIDEYDFEQHASKYLGESPYRGSIGSNQVVEPITSSSISSSASSGVSLGVQKMQPRQKYSQSKLSPKLTNHETHSSPSAGDKEPSTSNPFAKIQNRPSNVTPKKVITNKRVKQIVEPTPPPEPSTESSESVRSKLRESLAAAFKLVLDEGNGTNSSQGTEFIDADKVREQEKSGDMAAGQSVDFSVNKHPAETDIPEGVNCSATSSDTNEGNNDAGTRNASTRGDASDDQTFMKDDLQPSSVPSVASNIDSEAHEDMENHIDKKLKLTHDALIETNSETQQRLASEIEDELFRLFGAVNKKYKEKGRSLLFNLKDRHNPELRKRVFSGEINPARLCSMAAEELASKELTQWRIAKAEELAQMVVLPDSDVGFKSFVKKTHKGEVEVEVGREENASEEVVLAGNAFSKSMFHDKDAANHNKSNSVDRESSFSLKSIKDVSVPEKSGSNSVSDNRTSEQHENTDLMQDFMVEDFKDANSLPSIPTLDEFMKDLDEEPPFPDMMAGAVQGSPSSRKEATDRSEANSGTAEFYCEDPAIAPCEIGNKSEHHDKSTFKLDIASVSKGNVTAGINDFNVKVDSTATSPAGCRVQASRNVPQTRDSADVKSYDQDSRMVDGGNRNNVVFGRNLNGRFTNNDVNGEPVWEGLIQLNISSLVTALGFYRSGEKASMKEWPTFLEIKGRVRLDSFERFLQDLRLCRSRAIMILQLCWKEGSPESGRVKLHETIDSYVTDERVGFAEPVPGLELYFCPPHTMTTQILKTNLSKEHAKAVTSVHSGFICVAVLRKSPAPSPDPPMPPATSAVPQHPPVSGSVAYNHNVRNGRHSAAYLVPPPRLPAEIEMEDDDVPPGFGPSAVASRDVASRDEDDLPEFDFVRSSATNTSITRLPSKPLNHHGPPVQQQSSAPVHHFRELINKYGQNQNRIQPGNLMAVDDDDDIPEWQAHQQETHLRQPLNQQPYPCPPAPPLPLHYNQQPNQMIMPPRLPGEPVLIPPPNYHPHQQQFPAAGQWPRGSGQQPWRSGAAGPAQPQYSGRLNPYRRQGGGGQPQRGMGRSRRGHFFRG